MIFMEVLYEKVNKVEGFTIDGINMKKITLKSKIENSIIIRIQLNNIAKIFKFSNTSNMPEFDSP